MPRPMIGAEVVPQPGKAVEVAKALQKLGLKVLHIGHTSVSVQGLEAVWRDIFPVSFEAASKSQHPLAGAEVAYRRPTQDPVLVPTGLAELIAAVAFVEPPEFF